MSQIRFLHPEKYTNNLLIYFFFDPFQDAKGLPSVSPLTYQDKVLEPGVQTVVNSNKIKLEPNDDLVDEGYSS